MDPVARGSIPGTVKQYQRLPPEGQKAAGFFNERCLFPMVTVKRPGVRGKQKGTPICLTHYDFKEAGLGKKE